MDRSWMYNVDRISDKFQMELKSFLDFSVQNASDGGLIRCPCYDCNGRLWLNTEEVSYHITRKGFQTKYDIWYHNGETIQGQKECATTVRNEMENMIYDRFPIPPLENADGVQQTNSNTNKHFPCTDQADEVDRVRIILEDAKAPVYQACSKMTKLEFIIRLYHGKTLYGFSNTGIDYLLTFMKDLLPDDACIPENNYVASKLIDKLGFSSSKIHACPNDCSLFWKENAELTDCKICGTSRWKSNTDGTLSKVPEKVMWHFPLIPRLQKLFLTEEMAKNMRWHEDERNKVNDELVHPADGLAWKKFNRLHPQFAVDPRNVRLGLSCDGFNPFRQMHTSHSTWPVFVHIYNIAPWLCMKKPLTIMALLISGPTDPGNDIDIYLQPLINELKDLWNVGVQAYDAYKKEYFLLRAALLWMINDFPAYGMMAGWSTKGKLSCPICMKNTRSRRLKFRQSFSFIGHRRFLPLDHPYRKNRRQFDNGVEKEKPPQRLSGDDILEQLEGLQFDVGKVKRKSRKRRDAFSNYNSNWRKKSIFYELPYWSSNLLRHCLDVMHIEKNICEMLLATMLNVKGKTKDDLRSRRDLMDWGIKPSLHPEQIGSNKWRVPPASYVMTSAEKKQFLQVLESLRVPDGYSSNISKRVNTKEVKLRSLKTHDYHVLLHELIPISIRHLMSNNVRFAVIRLCHFFCDICAKRLSRDMVRVLQKNAAVVLCDLEKIFPPSFFTCMLHVTVHLPTELLFGGPVSCRWMYPTERMMCTMKSYVRNKNYPEGSIVKGFLAQECMDFCSLYLVNVSTRFNRPMRTEDEQYDPIEPVFPSLPQSGGICGSYSVCTLSMEDWEMAHRTVLFNCDIFDEYIKEHKQIIQRRHRSFSTKRKEQLHSKEFPTWLKSKVQALSKTDISPEMLALSFGPNNIARECKGLVINGFKFIVHSSATKMVTQHDGVMISATTDCYASSSDMRPRSDTISYYGVVEKIIILDYYAHGRVAMMKCKWFDSMTRQGIHIDNCGFRVIDMSRQLHTDEPFILASQAKQVFYVPDPLKPQLGVIVDVTPRHIFDEGIHDIECLDATVDTRQNLAYDENDDVVTRADCDPEIVSDN